MKYKTGLIIGRFQPFHKGHLYLVKKALENVENLIIAVGSVNKNDENNPFNFKDRKKYIKASLKKHNLLNKIIKIVPLVDYPEEDDYWLEQLKLKTGSFDAVFGNNEWVNGILENSGVKVIRVPLYKRYKYEGVRIREEMKNSKDPQKVLKEHMP
jgi:nicotinamide-nucleotide adenylyltransferase